MFPKYLGSILFLNSFDSLIFLSSLTFLGSFIFFGSPIFLDSLIFLGSLPLSPSFLISQCTHSCLVSCSYLPLVLSLFLPASYPFTTLQPQLGVMSLEEEERLSLIEGRPPRRVTIADLPGLIEGASNNVGLGHEFLKHVERTKGEARKCFWPYGLYLPG